MPHCLSQRGGWAVGSEGLTLRALVVDGAGPLTLLALEVEVSSRFWYQATCQ